MIEGELGLKRRSWRATLQFYIDFEKANVEWLRRLGPARQRFWPLVYFDTGGPRLLRGSRGVTTIP